MSGGKAKRELSTKERVSWEAWRAAALVRAERVVQGEAVGIRAEMVHADLRRKLRANR